MQIVNHIIRDRKVIIGLVLVALLPATYTLAALSNTANQKQVSNRTDQLPRYGIAAGGNLSNLSDDELSVRLDGIKALGGGWLRIDFQWDQIQPDSATAYNWTSYDHLVDAATKRDLKILGILDFTPTWARPAHCLADKQCAPARPSDYGRFAGAVSTRYAPQGLHYWEIWNEANTTTFFKPKPDTGAYTKLLKSAHTAIHSHDHDAIVITASTAPAATKDGNIAPIEFLDGIYRHGGENAFDAVGAHPYTYPVTPDYLSAHAWAQLATTPVNLRAIMITHGDKLKKIWLTEFGAPTGGPGSRSSNDEPNLSAQPDHVSENLQATMLKQAFELHEANNWMGPLLIYSDRDTGTSTDTNENFFGLMRANGSHKPAYDVFVDYAASN